MPKDYVFARPAVEPHMKVPVDIDLAMESMTDTSISLHNVNLNTSLLHRLCEKHGSDKGGSQTSPSPFPWPPHAYADVYDLLFSGSRHVVQRVFECGIGTNNPDLPSSMGRHGVPGASLRVWRDYFPNAHIFGADIDRATLFAEDRITTAYVDQTDPESVRALWDELTGEPFDVMIDDGLHTYDAAISLFEGSIGHLAPNGIYIIEDVIPFCFMRLAEYFSERPYAVTFVSMPRVGVPKVDERLVIVRHPG